MQGKSIKVKLLWNIYGDVELNQTNYEQVYFEKGDKAKSP